MEEVAEVPALRAWRREARAAGRRVALVPTMGFLHAGHLALVDDARRRAELVVMSIFVNPLQFGPGEDFDRYPRDLNRDRALVRDRRVDLLFVPTVATMYPPGADTRIVPGAAGDRWEGAARPGHFAGVLTVVAKLFHLVEPEVACFGQKDIQQVTLVRRMVRDLDLPVELSVVPTVREEDGLALSSRNSYLGPNERQDALALNRGLRAAAVAWRTGERAGPALEAVVAREIAAAPALRADYIAAIDPEHLQRVDEAVPGTILAAAVRVGRTRLIDNLILR
ncbi:MAG TPA: pantoate--beta-alanine ligase [Gemmatimonadales bacterium]|jgi:pantoate--beta-alanine ligase|nr:pantoate--beta-alanine ligase [Gemmatimonadales bacterium]